MDNSCDLQRPGWLHVKVKEPPSFVELSDSSGKQ